MVISPKNAWWRDSVRRGIRPIHIRNLKNNRKKCREKKNKFRMHINISCAGKKRKKTTRNLWMCYVINEMTPQNHRLKCLINAWLGNHSSKSRNTQINNKCYCVLIWVVIVTHMLKKKRRLHRSVNACNKHSMWCKRAISQLIIGY